MTTNERAIDLPFCHVRFWAYRYAVDRNDARHFGFKSYRHECAKSRAKLELHLAYYRARARETNV